MSKKKIAALLYAMKKTGESLMSISGELFSADELLTMLFGRAVSELEGERFISQ